MNKVAVIVPTFNEEKALQLTLDNLRNQTYKDFELIIKDGLSTDRTVEIATRYAAKVISERDVSAGDARNQATRNIDKNCSVIVFVDADTTLAPDALERITQDFERYCVSFIIPKFLPRQETVRTNGRLIQLPHPAIKLWFAFEHLFRKYVDNYGGGMCMPVDAQIFRNLGGFRRELKVCEDIELSYRLRKMGRALVDDKILVYVSTRRYLREGVIRGLLTYLLYRTMWHLGVHQPIRAEAR
jgi:glycosyltransferase involved in cell wall biosynthesis